MQQTPALSQTCFDLDWHACCTRSSSLRFVYLGTVVAREVGPAGSHHPMWCRDTSRQAAGTGGQGCSLQLQDLHESASQLQQDSYIRMEVLWAGLLP